MPTPYTGQVPFFAIPWWVIVLLFPFDAAFRVLKWLERRRA